ncbi:MotA/TolQ/ExbB proton channel family protein [Parvibaculum sp.]|jgi:biopolymer transport protein ExbB|uniref:MotA/TolQ/ExbB proton channel family protein n=1 Tax=Parvibaculum sp. TaxID=2024848 RepID=UPI000C3B5DE5|nr:MotA/TolQ/ExbB proton channel family protein [Parvibaculum sp.]MAM93796.1 flagellar motor protein MotA [Parvibaculum sp.]|tara:strand:- start:34822 stop:35610 length:789 start_codon:yes stop_codon:yes gene_type:complete
MPEEATSVDAANGAVEGVSAAADGASNATTGGAADIIAQGGSGDVWYSIGSLIDKGGPIVAILLVLSVISAAVILLKIVQFWTSGLSRRGFVDPAVDKIERGDLGGSLEILKKHKTPLARAMAAGVRAKMRGDLRDEDVAAEIQRVGTMELGSLQRYLRWLEVIGNISPLLGLLGTVIGMINAFQSLEAAGTQVDPALLSGGIWVALLTTAVGLIVALPAITALNLFEGKVDQVRLSMRDGTSRVIAALHARPGSSQSRAAQ